MKLSEPAVEVVQLLDRLERLARAGEASGALNPAQWEALRFLARANRFSRTPAALAAYLGSTRGTVSQSLIALEEKGYVSRQPSDRDRRSIELALTALGEKALKGDPIRSLVADIAKSTPAELAVLVQTLRTALQRQIERNGGRAFGACFTCRHFRKSAGPSARTPHYCSLLNEPLTTADSEAICVEQEVA